MDHWTVFDVTGDERVAVASSADKAVVKKWILRSNPDLEFTDLPGDDHSDFAARARGDAWVTHYLIESVPFLEDGNEPLPLTAEEEAAVDERMRELFKEHKAQLDAAVQNLDVEAGLREVLARVDAETEKGP